MNDYWERLLSEIGRERYDHSIGVMNTAIELAKYHNIDEDKARIGGLLHDCGKLVDKGKLLKIGFYSGIIGDNLEDLERVILHGFIGAWLAKEEYGIGDQDILNSIKYHTTGRKDMSDLEKVIYLADYIEPGRYFEGIEEIRNQGFKDLDLGLLMAMNSSIRFLIEGDKYIHPLTIEARNDILKKIEGR